MGGAVNTFAKFGLLVAAWGAFANSALARVDRDLVPDAETAMLVARLAMDTYYKGDPSMDYMRNRRMVAALRGKVWVVEFLPQSELRPGESCITVTIDGGYMQGVEIAKNDARIRAIGHIPWVPIKDPLEPDCSG